MSIDPTTLPACTQEDGSDPGQPFPCHWDAALMGNGIGDSFVMLDQLTYVYDDPAVQAQHEAGLSPANDGGVSDADLLAAMDRAPQDVADAAARGEAWAQVPAAQTEAQVQVLASPAPALAETGPTDPIMWAAAALMVTIGAVLAPVGKRRRVSRANR